VILRRIVRCLQDKVDVIIGALDLGALLRVQDVLDGQRVQPEDRADLLHGWHVSEPAEVDPVDALRPADERLQVIVRAVHLAGGHAAGAEGVAAHHGVLVAVRPDVDRRPGRHAGGLGAEADVLAHGHPSAARPFYG